MGHDIHDYSTEVEKAVARIQNEVDAGRIPREDYRLIDQFLKHYSGNKSPKTLQNYASGIKRLAVASDKPFAEWTPETIRDLFHGLRTGVHPSVKDSGLSQNTIRSYQCTLRKFAEVHDGLAFDKDDIELDDAEESKVSPSEILSPDEVNAMMDRCGNARDRALIALLAATGQRVNAIGSLQIKDIHLDETPATMYLDAEKAGLKGASGKRPLIWAKSAVQQWLNVHPRADNPDAYVFCVRDCAKNVPERAGEHLSYDSIRHALLRAADNADIEKPVNPHNFRHTAITRMVNKGLSEQRIKFIAGWGKDSSQFDTYANVREDEHVNAVAGAWGVEVDDDDEPFLEVCPQCSESLRPHAVACDSCGMPLTQEAAETQDKIEEDTYESAKQYSDEEKQKELDVFREMLDENPDLLDDLS